MTIEKMKELKDQLEKDLTALIADFESETGVQVSDLRTINARSNIGGTLFVKVEVEL